MRVIIHESWEPGHMEREWETLQEMMEFIEAHYHMNPVLVYAGKHLTEETFELNCHVENPETVGLVLDIGQY